mmetsp:Transcript_27626/g.75245  ORF Transcript_27626/g.75245 Transcript_27626/m.75245 type:complete len:258 (+) Transcript_27626:2051-2824(+)
MASGTLWTGVSTRSDHAAYAISDAIPSSWSAGSSCEMHAKSHHITRRLGSTSNLTMSSLSASDTILYFVPSLSSGSALVGFHQRCDTNTIQSSSGCCSRLSSLREARVLRARRVKLSLLRGNLPTESHLSYGTTTIGVRSSARICGRMESDRRAICQPTRPLKNPLPDVDRRRSLPPMLKLSRSTDWLRSLSDKERRLLDFLLLLLLLKVLTPTLSIKNPGISVLLFLPLPSFFSFSASNEAMCRSRCELRSGLPIG